MLEHYYNDRYLLDVFKWDLTDRDYEVLSWGDYIVDNKCSIRYASCNLGVAKSTLHENLHKKLPKLSFELYECVVRQLSKNYKRYFK